MAQTIHFDSPNGEQKLHLNLSEYAWGIIREDMHSFEQNPHLATFLNRVFLQYRSMASASISQACSEWKEAFQVGLTDEQMERLLACHKKRLLEVVEGYPSGPGVKFRLNNRNYEALFVDNCPEAAYYSRAGKYVKAVLEEYARQTALRREEIYFWQEISAIREHLKNHTRLLIYSWNGRTYEVKPYGVLSDNRSMYHYLVGLSKSQSYPGAEFKVTSYRISRILKIKDGPYRLTGRLTRGEQALVEKRLKAVGVQFLVGIRSISPSGLPGRVFGCSTPRTTCVPFPLRWKGTFTTSTAPRNKSRATFLNLAVRPRFWSRSSFAASFGKGTSWQPGVIRPRIRRRAYNLVL